MLIHQVNTCHARLWNMYKDFLSNVYQLGQVMIALLSLFEFQSVERYNILSKMLRHFACAWYVYNWTSKLFDCHLLSPK